MAARLTDKKKKKIIADYIECGNYSATAKKNKVSDNTVRNIVKANPDISEKCEQKRKQNTVDMLKYMESKKKQAQIVLDAYITALADPEKISGAKLSDVATAMGIVIDKFINNPMKHEMDRQKMEIELLKLENQLKNSQGTEETKDNFMDALDAAAEKTWSESGNDNVD